MVKQANMLLNINSRFTGTNVNSVRPFSATSDIAHTTINYHNFLYQNSIVVAYSYNNANNFIRDLFRETIE